MFRLGFLDGKEGLIFQCYAHKDLIDPDGSKEKILIGTVELSEALTFADKDINENWERYKDRFLRRIKT